MSEGFQIINGTGSVQIDSSYLNLSYSHTVGIYAPNAGNGKTNMFDIELEPDKWYVFQLFVPSNGNLYFQEFIPHAKKINGVWKRFVRSTRAITAFVFVRDIAVNEQQQYIQIFNETGKTVFHGNMLPLNVRGHIQGKIDLGTINTIDQDITISQDIFNNTLVCGILIGFLPCYMSRVGNSYVMRGMRLACQTNRSTRQSQVTAILANLPTGGYSSTKYLGNYITTPFDYSYAVVDLSAVFNSINSGV